MFLAFKERGSFGPRIRLTSIEVDTSTVLNVLILNKAKMEIHYTCTICYIADYKICIN